MGGYNAAATASGRSSANRSTTQESLARVDQLRQGCGRYRCSERRRPRRQTGRVAARGSALVGARPVEGEVLAGASGPAPLESERLDLVLRRGGPGRDLTGSNLGAGRVVDLNPRPLGGGRSAERLGTSARLARDLDPPAAKIVVD